MSDSVKGIAKLITEDPDIFSDYQDKFSEHTVLPAEIYGDIVGILKDVASRSGLVLDHSKLKVKFNPAGITLKNIYLDCPDAITKRKLVQRVADVTGDDNIKHTFNKNFRVNLYNAINKEFADRVREELNLEVTHQAIDPEGSGDTSNVLPMATFTQPAITAEKPEEEVDMEGPMGAEPEGGPEAPPLPPEGGMGGMPGMGGGGGLGGLGDDLGGEEELPNSEEEVEDLDIDQGPFGLEEPEEEGEEAPPPKPGEEEEMIDFEEGIQKIAGMITDDPDVFSEAELKDCPGCGKANKTSKEECWSCGKLFRASHAKRYTGKISYEPPKEKGASSGTVWGKEPKFRG